MMGNKLLFCLVIIWISSATETFANEQSVDIHQRKLACRNLGGRCIKKKKKCPGDLSLETLRGKPYCKRRRRCCYPDPPTLVADEVKCGLLNTFPNQASQRIVNGADVSPGELSWQVALLERKTAKAKNVFCGGSIITERHILTAAHCFYDTKCDPADFNKIYVAVGNKQISDANVLTVKKQQITIFDPFTCTEYVNDIAIITINPGINLLKDYDIKPVCLPKDATKNYITDYAKVTGWGSTEGYDPDSPTPAPVNSNELKVAKIKVLENGKCNETYLNYEENIMLCAGDKDGCGDECQGTCIHDSGGPLMVDEEVNGIGGQVQIGIVSQSLGCAADGYPEIFTRVTAYLDWIEAKVFPLEVYTLP